MQDDIHTVEHAINLLMAESDGIYDDLWAAWVRVKEAAENS